MFVGLRFIGCAVTAVLLAIFATTVNVGAQPAPVRSDVLRDGFETQEPSWQREYNDTTVKLAAQERSQRAAHEGRLSERFQFEAGPGSQFFVSYATPKVPVSDDLRVGLYVRSSRAGVQIFARIVLPADVDPETKAPSYVLIPGTIFDQTDRWQRLELLHMLPVIERQARVLRVSTRRPVRLDGAYLERVVVNLLGGPGESEVFLDQLEIEPVPKDMVASLSKAESGRKPEQPGRTAGPRRPRDTTATNQIRLERNLLERRGIDSVYQPWFPTAIDAPGADPLALRRAGFDVLVTDARSDPETLRPAIDAGALLMMRLDRSNEADGPQQLLEQMNAFPRRDAVAFWHLGNRLGRRREQAMRIEELTKTRELVSAVRQLDDVSHLTIANVDGEIPSYSRAPAGLDIVGIQPQFWAGSLDFLETYRYLVQRRLLTVRSKLDIPFWAWIPASTSPEVMRNIWGDDPPPSWGTPPVQPTQLRLMTYLALAAGCRGVVFTGDADLTRSGGAGRALWIEMSFLNLEIDLCERILAQNEEKIRDYDVFDPEPLPLPSNAIQQTQRRPTPVKELLPRPGMLAAAVPLLGRKGALLLVGDFGSGAQFQPGQLAAGEVTITLALPEGAQAFEITPAEVRVLPRERVAVGTRITLKEFDTSSLILCTSDLTLFDRVRKQVESIRHKTVPLAIEQAEILLQSVIEINGRLAADGHEFHSKKTLELRRRAGIQGAPPDVPDLLAESQKSILSARAAWERQEYDTAWAEARRATRPLRIIMNGHWVQAVIALNKAVKSFYPDRPGEEVIDEDAILKPKKKKDEVEVKFSRRAPLFVPTTACPPGISFFTLPEQYIWLDWISGRPGYRFGANRVPSGDFEDPHAITESGWLDVSYKIDGLISKVSIVRREEVVLKRPPGIKPDKKALPRPIDQEYLDSKRVLKLEVKAPPDKLDTVAPQFLDFPVAAVRTPPIPVESNNLIRISVLVRRVWQSATGAGGLIVRDSIGGEPFQFRTSGPLPEYYRVVLFRKAPANGTFTVMLGLAGYGEAYFDNLRVEVIEHDANRVPPDLVQRRQDRPTAMTPTAPEPTPPTAAARPRTSRTPPR
jgi:hypothetical protein